MSEQVKFYLDEHVHPAVAAGLRRRGVDVLTTKEAGMLSAYDDEHLGFAKSKGRVIFTQDEDFLRLHAGGTEHAGIVYVPQRTSVGYILRGLMLIYEVLSAEEMENQVEFL
jgi:uncharacterized protein with PIN domain